MAHADDCGIRTRGICDCGDWDSAMPNGKPIARELAEAAARELFKRLSDSYSMSGHVAGRSRDLVPVFTVALELAFEKGVTEGMKRALTGAAA